jgi:hypothetical protein
VAARAAVWAVEEAAVWAAEGGVVWAVEEAAGAASARAPEGSASVRPAATRCRTSREFPVSKLSVLNVAP